MMAQQIFDFFVIFGKTALDSHDDFVFVVVGTKGMEICINKVLLSPWKPTVLGCVLSPLFATMVKSAETKKV
jgi:hypothetical protein